MGRVEARRWLIVCALLTCAGCGAHGGGQRPAAVGFEPVTHIAPEGTLSAVKSPPVSRPAPTPPPAPAEVPAGAQSVIAAAKAAPPASKPAPAAPVAARVDSTPAPAAAPTSASAPPATAAASAAAPSAAATSAAPATVVETPAEVLTRVPPVYPKGADVWGIVLVSAYVDTLGNVTQTRIERSIRELDTAALAAVRKYRFKPATRDGQPTSGWVSVPVRFTKP